MWVILGPGSLPQKTELKGICSDNHGNCENAFLCLVLFYIAVFVPSQLNK